MLNRMSMSLRGSRKLLLAASLAMGATFAGTVQSDAQTKYPEKPIRIMVPFGPGGAGDLTMRLLAQRMQEITGQPMVADNRPGAGGRLAMRAVLDSPADGYTLGVTGQSQAIGMTLFEKKAYDIVDDFTQVSIVATFDILLAVGDKSPFKNLKDVVDAARKSPGKLSFGTVLPGTTQNLSAYLFMQQEKLEVEVVTYKTSPDLITAIMRGEIDVGFDYYAALVGPVQDKQLRVLASGGETRTDYLPNVPTAKESGFPNYIVTSYNALSTPKGLPAETLKVLNQKINDALNDPGVREKGAALGLKMGGSTPQEMRERMIADVKRWGDVIEKAKIPKQ